MTACVWRLAGTYNDILKLHLDLEPKSLGSIDSAPTIPRDKAMLFEMTDVIIYPVKGKSAKTKN